MALSIQARASGAVLLLLLTLFSLPHSVHGYQTTESADLHPIQLEMMPFVEDMLEHAINGYLSYAFPKDTLASLTGGIAKPIKSVPLFKVHATLIDMLDTVAVMGRPELFRRLAQWVEKHVDFSKGVNVTAHELNTRIIGGLIGAHYMYEEGIVEVVPEEHDYQGGLLKLAVDLADRIMLLFDTPTGIPYGSVHLRLNRIYNRTLYAECRESGGYLMEFAALSKATGDPKYETAARRAAQALFDLRENTTSAIPTAVNISTGAWATEYVSLGEGGITTLEHSIKEHALGGEPGDWYRFEVSRRANSRNLRLGGLYNELRDSKRPLTRHAWHGVWAAGYPAMLAMAGHIAEAAENVLSSQSIYRRLGSMPAKTKLDDRHETVKVFEDMLHPDHIKSLYSLYRTTKDPVYLTMGKESAMILHIRSRTVAGFASLSTLTASSHRGRMSDTMDSFLLSENLKYLFLLFDECNVLHLQGSGVHPSCAELVEDARTSGSSRHTRVGWLLSPGGHPIPNHAGWWNQEASVSLANNQRSFAAGEVTGEVIGLDTVRADIPLTAHVVALVPGLQTLESAREERIRFRTEPLHRRRQRHLYSMLRGVISEKIARGEAMMHLEVSKIQGSKKPPIRGSQNLAVYLQEVESAVPSEYTCHHLPANEVMHCGHTIQTGVSPLDY